MGRDKALVEIDGVALVTRVAGALSQVCTAVWAAGPPHLAGGLACIADRWPGEGPLGAIATVLDVLPSPAQHVMIVACDLAQLDPATLRCVRDAWQPGDDVVVATTDRTQPLCAMWDRRCAGAVEACFVAGERSVRRCLATLATRTVEVPGGSLRNVNTPGDLGCD